jgi:hypothetical protein
MQVGSHSVKQLAHSGRKADKDLKEPEKWLRSMPRALKSSPSQAPPLRFLQRSSAGCGR